MALLMENKYARCSEKTRRNGLYLLLVIAFVGIMLPQTATAQERFQELYAPKTVQKYKMRSMRIDLYAGTDGVDSAQLLQREPDFTERFFYDEEGRPNLYEATDVNIRKHGTAGPHLLSRFEYSDNGLESHRHDSTAFGRASEWHFKRNAVGKSVEDRMFLPDTNLVCIQKQYLYDLKGRLQKIKTNRSRAGEGLSDECVWVFFIHDNQSFNATSLSPQDMARCQCNLEYLDDEGHAVRRVVYDSTGTIALTVLLTYDRTGKPIRMEWLDGVGKVLKAWVDIVYGRNGLVTIDVGGSDISAENTLGRFGMMGQAFVVEHWVDWKLLRELRIKTGGHESLRYLFDYSFRN